MKPPFEITPFILELVSDISLLIGKYEGLHAPLPQPILRRQNKIKTIHGSLAIEGNTLSLDQVTALIDKKPIAGPKKDVLEVQNAIRLYESAQELNPLKMKDILHAHLILMKGLAPDAGKFRAGEVGILKGSRVSHIAPPSKQVPKLISELFDFLKNQKQLSPLIRACVFHYELEFIHPFSDGNGRMGRFWQSLILTRFHQAFEYIPVESLIKKRQSFYYRALEQSDKTGNSTLFLEFSLSTLRDALKDFLNHLKPETETFETRIDRARAEFLLHEFTRNDYLKFFKTISTATASRDLAQGVLKKRLKRLGMKAQSRYRFIF